MTGVLVVDALLVEHGEHNTGDCFDNGEFEPKLNLDLFCLEWRVDVGTFFCVLRVVSVGSLWENLWNLLLHLHGAKMSELSLITLDLSVLIRCRISILSTIQSLQLAVHADFMHWMGSPCHRIRGAEISFILAFTSFLLLQSLHRLAKCLAKESAPA